MAALLCPAAAQEPFHLESTAPDSDLTDSDPPVARLRLVRESVILGVALFLGFLVAPFFIWTVGHYILGPYNPGGPGRLLADYMTGLAHGSPIFWAVALGPYLLTLVVRSLYFLARGG
jgi:hypothetical protein